MYKKSIIGPSLLYIVFALAGVIGDGIAEKTIRADIFYSLLKPKSEFLAQI